MQNNIWSRVVRSAKSSRYPGLMKVIIIVSMVAQWMWLLYGGALIMGTMIDAGHSAFAKHYLTFSAVTFCYAIVLLNFHRILSLEQEKNTNFAVYEQYVANLYDNTRFFRHEFRNRLHVLDGYYQSQDWAGFRSALQHWNDEATKLGVQNIDALYRLQDTAVREVLILCLAEAEKNQLHFHIQFHCTDASLAMLSTRVDFLSKAIHTLFTIAASSSFKTVTLAVTDEAEPRVRLSASVDDSSFDIALARKKFRDVPFPVEISLVDEGESQRGISLVWSVSV